MLHLMAAKSVMNQLACDVNLSEQAELWQLEKASSHETLISRGLGGTLHTQDHRCPCEELGTIAVATHATLWGHENGVVAPLRCPRTR